MIEDKMTLKEFKEVYNLAPLSLEEFAEAAENVIDCPGLSASARVFLESQEDFELQLEYFGIEIG